MRNVRNFVMVIVAVVLMAGMVSEVVGDTDVDDPMQLVGTSNSQEIRMNYTDRLMERIDGVDYEVDKGEGEYYVFFLKVVSGDLVFGGFIGTNNYGSNGSPGYEAWCMGYINRDIFLEGESPDYILSLYDPDGGLFAVINGSEQIIFDDNLIEWESGKRYRSSGDIEYEGVNGGLLDFVFGPISIDTIWMELVVLFPAPVALVSPLSAVENVDPNSSLVWDGEDGSVYEVYLYTDPNVPELILEGATVESLDVSSYLDWDSKYYWKVDKIVDGDVVYSSAVWTFETAGYKCSEDIVGDFNGDCVVDFVDFAMFAENWMVEVPRVPDIPGQ